MATSEPLEGWLQKKAGKRWKRRFFAVEGNRVKVYSNDAKKMSLGSTVLTAATVDLIPDTEHFVFQLAPPSGKPSVYGADSDEDRSRWVSGLGSLGATLAPSASDPSLKPPPPASSEAAEAVVAGAPPANPKPAPPPPPPITSPVSASIAAATASGGTAVPAAGSATSAATAAAGGAGGSAAVPPVPPSRLAIRSDNPEFLALMLKYKDPTEENLTKLFNFIDSSGDGSISVCEWCSAIRKSKAGATQLKRNLGQQLALFNSIDADGSGEVDKEEFVTGLNGVQDEALHHWMAAQLATLEVAPVAPKPADPVTKPGEEPPMSEEEIESKTQQLGTLYDIIDTNGDGDVTVSELLGSFRKYTSEDPLSTSLDAQLRLFASMDADGSGGLDREEFVSAALHIRNDAFTEWIDRVLYEDRVAANAERLAEVDARAAGVAATEKKKDRKAAVVDAANPFFTALSTPTSAGSGGGTPTSVGTPTTAGARGKPDRALMLLGRVAGKPKRGRKRGGKKK